uniref:JmjC domain-containing protein n=1 Tax=Populus alba TaxID=43335 RepID=A0A4U5R2P4_POPAL|nr:hypothetical protein D5086_0000008290 [Populus alba]
MRTKRPVFNAFPSRHQDTGTEEQQLSTLSYFLAIMLEGTLQDHPSADGREVFTITNQRFEQFPSPTEFASLIESKNVLNGCIKNWKAFVEWNPANGGLDYLQVGSSTMEAMLSKTAPVFYGDIRSHERQIMRNTDNGPDSLLQSGRHQVAVTDVEPSLLSGDAPRQIYIAQAGILLFLEAGRLLFFLFIAFDTVSVALENPEFSLYPRAKCSVDYAQKVFLHAGDALFIPEGWAHGCILFAENIKKASAVKLSQFGDFVFSNMLYWIAKSMYKFKIDRQRNGQNRALPKASPGSEKLKRHTCERLRNVGGDHGCCDSKCHSRNRVYKGRTNSRKLNCMNLNHRIIQLLKFFGHLIRELFRASFFPWRRHNFPRTLDALILHLLSPVGVEVLTWKFDEIDQQTTEDDRNKFYQGSYGAFDDQFAAMGI